jgi:hypothetical protein
MSRRKGHRPEKKWRLVQMQPWPTFTIEAPRSLPTISRTGHVPTENLAGGRKKIWDQLLKDQVFCLTFQPREHWFSLPSP